MKKYRFIIIAAILLIGFAIGFVAGHLKPVTNPEVERIFVPEECNFDALVDTLDAHHCLDGRHTAFSDIAKLRGLPNHIKAGSYLVRPKMKVLSLVQKLYSGNQDALRVTINKHRTPEQFCSFMGDKLALSADSLLALLRNNEFCAQYGCDTNTILSIFMQDTYEFYWTISPEKLVDRLYKESERFWKDNQQALDALGLTRQQVVTLASIVDEETNCNEEKADIASVYLNRYRIGMALQADPTVKYALRDFSIQRIWGKMLAFDSPYNTYRYAGLPPGPICIPSRSSIKAVLQNKQTHYLFFCAKEDFSGRHNFSSTIAEHTANAQKFHKALNERKIR